MSAMGLNVTPGKAGQFGKHSKTEWTQDKKAGQEGKPFVEEEALQGAQALEKAAPAKPVQAPTQVEKPVKAPEVQEPRTWQVTVADLVQQFVQENIPNTAFNKLLGLLMMQYGVELSSNNFEQVLKLLKGKTSKSALESAVISMSKGLGKSSESVDFLNGFLSKSIQTARGIQKFHEALANFRDNVLSGKAFESGIMSGLGSVISELDDEMKSLLKKAKGDQLTIAKFRRGGLIKDLYSFHQLLEGLLKKTGEEIDPKMLKAIRDFQAQIRELMGNFTAQSILSKSSEKQSIGILENYAYWQVPNLMATDPGKSHIDILLKKEPMKKEDNINPERTKVIIRLDTPDLGEISLIMVILNKKIWYTFNSEREATTKLITSFQGDLKRQMESQGYDMAGFNSIRRKIDIKKFILPKQNLDDFVRINAEV